MNHEEYLRIKDEANRRAREIVPRWLPGRQERNEWIAKNPTRDDKNAGSFKINLKTGKWKDWANDDKGGCIVSLAMYLHGDRTPYEAAANLAKLMGL